MKLGSKSVVIIALLMCSLVWAGPNEDASISFDADLSAGDQGVSEIDAPGVDAEIRFEVRVQSCNTLDSYSFELLYHVDDLLYAEFSTANLPREDNILNQKGDYLFDSPIVTDDDTGPVGVVTISVVNTTDDPANCPSGDGLLGKVTFYSKVEAPRSIQFGDVEWKDPTGVSDMCKDENKGEFFMGGGSLPVELSAFDAHVLDGAVNLTWATESEKNSWGFNVYRSLRAETDYERINGEMIEAAGNSTTHREYAFMDSRVESQTTYYYKLQQLDINGAVRWYGPLSVTVTQAPSAAPEQFVLYENYPNPFNPSTTIQYDVAEASVVTLEIFDITGKRVKTLVNDDKAAGSYSVVWDATDSAGRIVPNGAYVYRLRAGSLQFVNKLMVLK